MGPYVPPHPAYAFPAGHLTRAPRASASLPPRPGITLDATAEGSAVNCGNAAIGPCQHYLMEAPLMETGA